jgi:hypothetical protein
MFWFMLQVDPIQSFLHLKIGLPLPVLKAESSGSTNFEIKLEIFKEIKIKQTNL